MPRTSVIHTRSLNLRKWVLIAEDLNRTKNIREVGLFRDSSLCSFVR